MQPIQVRIRNEQVALLYAHLPTSLLASIVVACVLIVAVWGDVSKAAIIGWSTAFLIVNAARFSLFSRFNKTQADSRNMHKWCLRFLAGSVASGVTWGLAGVLLMPEGFLGHQIFVIFILGGIMAGASLSLSAILMAYASFCVPVVLPVSVWLFLQGTPLHLAMSALVLFFSFSLLLIGRHLNRALVESFRLRFENVDLITNMEQEVATRRKTESRLRAHNNTLEMLAAGQPLGKVLTEVNLMVEEEIPDAKSSILLLDEKGKHLLSTASSSLPDAYNDAINGGAIGPAAGSCGTAAFRNETVIVEDIATDPLWKNYKELALSHGLKACWSVPICNSRKKIIGTFALYYAEIRKPCQAEIKNLTLAANLAAIAIEHSQAEERLNQMAHYDPLSKLPNRALFMDRLKQSLVQAKRRKQKVSLLFVDLDNFKIINDTLGHEAGDKALKEIARRLQACVREVDTAARLGGDEFTIILTEVHSKKDAALVSKKVIEALCKEIKLAGRKYFIGCSIGISLYPADSKDADSLLRNADTAMYQAKKKGGKTSVFYSEMKAPGKR